MVAAPTAAWLISLPEAQRNAFLAGLAPQDKAMLRYRWSFWARPQQLEPEGNWFIHLIQAGRGWGKSRTGAEWIRGKVEAGKARRIALVGRTAADVRDVMVRGESGILACSPPEFRPEYEPSKRLLTWLNGAIATCYSADEPDLLRGPEHDCAWADEIASWQRPEAWDMLLLGLRLGERPQVVATTTPKPTALIRSLVEKARADTSVVITRGSTYENEANLAASFLDQVVDAYHGTRLGRQEIYGELLEDVIGALWQWDWILNNRVAVAPDLQRIVVAIDPATTHGEDSDYTGLAVVGRGNDDQFYVLHSEGVKLSPDGWAQRALSQYDRFEADRVIAERNNGGDMVEATIRNARRNAPVTTIHASRGKRLRAEPVALLYEQGRVHHVGTFESLEDQLTRFPTATENDDEVDALVYAITELSGETEWEFI